MSEFQSRLAAALAGRYGIKRELGQGGMATVYLAADLRHDREVAIKVLHPELAAALGGERFLSEIKTTARLQHPHILPRLDSGTADALLFYVMPYVAGETLRDRLQRERQLPVDEALRIEWTSRTETRTSTIALCPDGRWLAYSSDDGSGVSRDGGVEPRWSRSDAGCSSSAAGIASSSTWRRTGVS